MRKGALRDLTSEPGRRNSRAVERQRVPLLNMPLQVTFQKTAARRREPGISMSQKGTRNIFFKIFRFARNDMSATNF